MSKDSVFVTCPKCGGNVPKRLGYCFSCGAARRDWWGTFCTAFAVALLLGAAVLAMFYDL